MLTKMLQFIFSGSTVLSVWGLGVDHYESSQSWMLFDAGVLHFSDRRGCAVRCVYGPPCQRPFLPEGSSDVLPVRCSARMISIAT